MKNTNFDYVLIDGVKHRVHNTFVAFSLIRMVVSKEHTLDRFEISVPKQWFYSKDEGIVFDNVRIEKIFNEQ